MSAARRCSMCDINWPSHDDYERCPNCNQHTSPMMKAKGPIMSEAEAKSKAAYMRFENYIENESEEERRERQERDANSGERTGQAEIALARERFRDVIRGAGFTEQERKDIERLESQLPMAHLNREDD